MNVIVRSHVQNTVTFCSFPDEMTVDPVNIFVDVAPFQENLDEIFTFQKHQECFFPLRENERFAAPSATRLTSGTVKSTDWKKVPPFWVRQPRMGKAYPS